MTSITSPCDVGHNLIVREIRAELIRGAAGMGKTFEMDFELTGARALVVFEGRRVSLVISFNEAGRHELSSASISRRTKSCSGTSLSGRFESVQWSWRKYRSLAAEALEETNLPQNGLSQLEGLITTALRGGGTSLLQRP